MAVIVGVLGLLAHEIVVVTPIGYQTSPTAWRHGRYPFSEYSRLGPLLLATVVTLLVVVLWPL